VYQISGGYFYVALIAGGLFYMKTGLLAPLAAEVAAIDEDDEPD
jgi:hypothetical protein